MLDVVHDEGFMFEITDNGLATHPASVKIPRAGVKSIPRK